jgi:hypothetical protein
MKHLVQKILIFLFKNFSTISNSKIVLFSRFMSQKKSTYLLAQAKTSKCSYVLNVNDYAVARRIYIGMDDEHLKTIKAIEWLKELSGRSISTIFDIGANIGHISIPLLKDGIIKESYMWEQTQLLII